MHPMKSVNFKLILSLLLIACTGMTAQAELQQVSIGGEIRVRWQDWENNFNSTIAPTLVGGQVRYPGASTLLRPIGDLLGGQNVVSFFSFNDDADDYSAWEQRTRLNVTADFTDDVTAFIEIESWNYWGDGFRSDYISGLDFPGGADVSMYQSYIEARNMWGTNLSMRIGRQEMPLGAEWLIGNNDNTLEMPGLSFDGILLTYAQNNVTFHAFWTKVFENFGAELDGDANVAGLYLTYAPKDEINLDAYFLHARDARSIADTRGSIFLETLEEILDLDDYPVTNLFTAGARLYGMAGAFDYNIEGAYQFGDASTAGILFKNGLYGDDSAEYDAWAAHAEFGYTVGANHPTRLHLLGAYFSGEDNRDLTLLEWLNPFRSPEASVSFNRLFSDQVYSVFLDDMGQMSNFWTAQAGVSVAASEKVDVSIYGAYFQANETFERPLAVKVNGTVIPIAGPLSFLTSESDDELGYEVGVNLKYRYSEDLVFSIGYARFLLGDGLEDGNYTDMNGLLFGGGSDDDDPNYFYAETGIKF